VAYRNKPDLWSEPLKQQDPKSYRWSLAGIMIFNLGIILSNSAARFGWHVSAEVAQWVAIGLGFACLFGGVVAYRASKRQVERDLAEMIPNDVRQGR
jgi:hypothetical protein